MTANALHPGVISTNFGKGQSVIFSGKHYFNSMVFLWNMNHSREIINEGQMG